jgi:hypothetical protein
MDNASGDELDKHARRLRVRGWRGCYPRDQIPAYEPGRACIVNLDDATGAGTHWVAIRDVDDASLFFDSYGLPPPAEVLSRAPHVVSSTPVLQDASDAWCGAACLAFLHANVHDAESYADWLATWSLGEDAESFRENRLSAARILRGNNSMARKLVRKTAHAAPAPRLVLGASSASPALAQAVAKIQNGGSMAPAAVAARLRMLTPAEKRAVARAHQRGGFLPLLMGLIPNLLGGLFGGNKQ